MPSASSFHRLPNVPTENTIARRWVEQWLVANAYLYVDGHVKAYTGKRKLAECWNAQRRMPLPGLLSYFAFPSDDVRRI